MFLLPRSASSAMIRTLVILALAPVNPRPRRINCEFPRRTNIRSAQNRCAFSFVQLVTPLTSASTGSPPATITAPLRSLRQACNSDVGDRLCPGV
jgi:hypothetical protein